MSPMEKALHAMLREGSIYNNYGKPIQRQLRSTFIAEDAYVHGSVKQRCLYDKHFKDIGFEPLLMRTS